MAKLIGPIGSKMRGKVGQIVAAKTVGGDTAIRSYQPQVKNPNTLRQQVSRRKMALASAIAAGLSEAIKIGYAKAAAGAKMYARNMFVRELIPQANGYFTVTNGRVIDAQMPLPLSKAVGISLIPAGTVNVVGGNGAVVTATNIGDVTLAVGENVGVIAVALNRDTMQSVMEMGVKPASGDTTVTIPEEALEAIDANEFYMFYKVIPEGLNGVATDTIPWKYPSATSVCVKLQQ